MKVIDVQNLSKIYNLAQVGTGTLHQDLNRSIARLRGKPDPYASLAELNDRSVKSKTNIVYALKDINFSVNKGEVLGIIGRNGAGKSTLLKLLSQITSPTTGHIKMKGRVASLLEVGTGMHHEMTAKENIFLNGSIMGMTRKEINAKFDEIVDFAGVAKYIDTPIKRFSSGMKVRLGFAVAAFLEPEILIVDEVLAVGDAKFQKKAIGKMQDVSRGGGRTVLFVSHNMESVQRLCKNCLLLSNGRLIAEGLTENIIKQYLDDTDEVENISLSNKYNKHLFYPAEILINDSTDKRSIFRDEEIRIKLKLVSRSTYKHAFRISLSVINESGIIAFSSLEDKTYKTGQIVDKKNLEASLVIPANLLNIGKWTFTLTIDEPFIQYLFPKQDIFRIEVKNRPGIDNYQKLAGVVSPELKWQTNY